MLPKTNYKILRNCEISSRSTAREPYTKPQRIKLNPPPSGTYNLSTLLNWQRLLVILSHPLLSHNLHLLMEMHMHQRSCTRRRMKKPIYSTGTTYDRVPIYSTSQCPQLTFNLKGCTPWLTSRTISPNITRLQSRVAIINYDIHTSIIPIIKVKSAQHKYAQGYAAANHGLQIWQL